MMNPLKWPFNRRTKQERYAARKFEQGLCVRCVKPNPKKTLLCSDCQNGMSCYRVRKERLNRANGLCVQCGKVAQKRKFRRNPEAVRGRRRRAGLPKKLKTSNVYALCLSCRTKNLLRALYGKNSWAGTDLLERLQERTL